MFRPAQVHVAFLFAAITLVGTGTKARVVFAEDLVAQQARNWHQWRGPEANGMAPFAVPPVEWDENKNIRWKIEVAGRGTSTPIIWENQLFVLTAINSGKIVETVAKPEDQPERAFGIKFPNTVYKFVVMAIDRNSGKPLWESTAIEALPHEGHHNDNSFATASPTTDGKRLYVSFGSRGLYCFDLTGKLIWKKELGNVSTRLSFGEASSPVVHGDSLVLIRDNEGESQILVLDAATGETRWKAERDEVSAWATPLVTEYKGRTQVITNASKRVRSYDLANGEVIWECGGQVSNVTPSPVRLNDMVYCMSGYRGSVALAIPLDSVGDVTETQKIAWRYNRDTPYVPSPLLYGDMLYFTKSNSGVLTCLHATTGKSILDATRLPGMNNIYASPVGAAERVYLVGRDGTSLVLRKSSAVEVLATNKLNDSVDASPALAGKQLFIRGHKFLYCIESRE